MVFSLCLVSCSDITFWIVFKKNLELLSKRVTFLGCYRFGARLTSLGYKTDTKNTMYGCNQFCKNNGFHLFQWNQNKNECKLFGQELLNEKEIFSKDVDSAIGIPDCNDEKVKWLKNPFEVPTTTLSTTATTDQTIESFNILSEENGNFKYFFNF
jgi:hypothetical protein